jgi:DNA-binding response OmpR family regulator
MARILLIEPDHHLARIYTAALSDAGHDVQHVLQAQEAVHTADKNRPDVVLLELQLAAHNGVEFLYEFRSYPEWQGIPVVLLTMVPPASLQLTSATKQQLGIAACLYKPETNLKKLLKAVDATL